MPGRLAALGSGFRRGIRRASSATSKALSRAGDSLASVSKSFKKSREEYWDTKAYYQDRVAQEREMVERYGESTRRSRVGAWASRQVTRPGVETTGKVIFYIFALLGGLPLIFNVFLVPGNISASLGWITSIVFLFGIFVGKEREARPAMGAIVMTFMVILFSYSYTEVVGQALFGYYWSPLQSFGETTFGPVALAFEKTSCQTSATFSCISEGPIICQQKQLECQKQQSKVEGNEQAIEFGISRFEPPQFDCTATGGNQFSCSTSVGYIEIQNKGDFDANNVVMNAESPVLSTVRDGESVDVLLGNASITACIGGKLKDDTCGWNLTKAGTSGTGGKGAIQIEYAFNENNLRFDNCGGTSSPNTCDSGKFVTTKFDVQFDYDTSVAYSVDVRGEDFINQILRNGESIAGTESRYSGGPVIASFWTPKYVQSGTKTLATAYLTNNRDGIAKNLLYCIYVPDGVTVDPKDNSVKGKAAVDKGCSEIPGNTVVACTWGSAQLTAKGSVTTGGLPDDNRRCTFYLTDDIGSLSQKRLDILGRVDYQYVIGKTLKQIQVGLLS